MRNNSNPEKQENNLNKSNKFLTLWKHQDFCGESSFQLFSLSAILSANRQLKSEHFIGLGYIFNSRFSVVSL